MRSKLFQRDRGVCAACKVDTEALKKEYHALRQPHPEFPTMTRPDEAAKTAFLERYEIPYGRISSDWWDADHITPVVEGGGECGLDNLRTLCIPCHARVTRELARRRAGKRKAEKIEQRDNERGLLAGL